VEQDGPTVVSMKLAVVALAASGCAMLTVQGPRPDAPQDRAPVCDARAKGPVVVDGFVAVTAALVGIALTGYEADSSSGGGNSPGGAVAIGAVTAGTVIGLTYSIVQGTKRARECRAAMLDWSAQAASP